jgi:hypothetical protein
MTDWCLGCITSRQTRLYLVAVCHAQLGVILILVACKWVMGCMRCMIFLLNMSTLV